MLSAAENAPSDSVRPIESAFESRVVRMKAKPDDKNVPVEWTYTNHWDFPLVVERFDESCGCLSGQVGQVSGQEGQTGPVAVAPGKSGTIRASFTPGTHRGLLRKSLHVRFIGHRGAVELMVEATIPFHVELSAQELLWKTGKSPEAKTIEITSGTGSPFKITGLPGVPEDQFAITTETIVEGTHYRLHITPKSTAQGQHCLQVRTDSPDPRDSVHAIFLSVGSTP